MPGLLVADEARTPCTNRCPTPGLLTESTNAVHTTHKLWQIDSFLLGLQWDSRFEWPEYSVGLAFFRLLSSGWRAWLLVFTYKEILQFLSTILVHQLSIGGGGALSGGTSWHEWRWDEMIAVSISSAERMPQPHRNRRFLSQKYSPPDFPREWAYIRANTCARSDSSFTSIFLPFLHSPFVLASN